MATLTAEQLKQIMDKIKKIDDIESALQHLT